MREVVGEVVIPEAVYDELTRKGQQRPGSIEVQESPWIRRQTAANLVAASQLPASLHRGEREAIVLAEELGAELLIDESQGRRIALQRGVTVVGTLRILEEAKRLGLVAEVRRIIGDMLATGYWMDDDLIMSFLRRIGEGNQ